VGLSSVKTWEWTVESFERAGEAGLFGEGAHADLIDGKVHVISPQQPAHAYLVAALRDACTSLDTGYVARAQLPLRLSAVSEIEPDVCVVVGPQSRYAHSHPGPQDVRLVIEVSLSSLGYDTGEKLNAYARHSVPEVWVVDLSHKQVLLYRTPEPAQGVFARLEARTEGRLEA